MYFACQVVCKDIQANTVQVNTCISIDHRWTWTLEIQSVNRILTEQNRTETLLTCTTFVHRLTTHNTQHINTRSHYIHSP